MDWNKEKTLFFISLIRDRPIIWDATSAEHKDKRKRHDAVDEVAKLMGISVKEVNTKWTSLRGQFTRENKKITGNRTSNVANAICTIKWFAYNEMETLMGGKLSQNSKSNIENSVEESFLSSIQQDTNETIQPHTKTPQPIIITSPPTKPVGASTDMVGPPTRKKNTGLCTDAMQPLLTIKDSNKRHSDVEDNLSCFAAYIVAQVRQLHPRLQIKAKFEISQLLYKLEMENHDYIPYSCIEKEQDSSLSDYSNFHTESSPSPHIENYSHADSENLQLPQTNSVYTVQIEDQVTSACKQLDQQNNSLLNTDHKMYTRIKLEDDSP